MTLNRPTQAWSEGDDALLLKLHKEGLSCSQIAAKLPGNRSRNAVIGRIHRQLHGKVDPRTSGRKSGVQPAVTRKPSAPRPLAGKTAPIIRRPLPAYIPGTPVDFLSLKASVCKFVVSGVGGHLDPFKFCGQDVQPNSSYCPHHHAIVYSGVIASPRKAHVPRDRIADFTA